MARRIKVVTITAEGRDKSKEFYLTEMPADQGERWAYRALLALSRGGIDLPPGMFDQGWGALAHMMPYFVVVGLKALHGAQWLEIEPLLEELMECIKFKPPGINDPAGFAPIHPGVNSQIEEISTRAFLRKEVVELHLGFSVADALLNSDPSPSSAPASASS